MTALARRIEPKLPTFRDANPARIANSGDSSGLSLNGLSDFFNISSTDAGANVNATTAMRVSAVFACVRLIAGAIAGLPLPIYQRSEDSRTRADHDYWWLLNERPCDVWSAAAYWEFMLGQILLRGDSISYLLRDRQNRIVAIIPFARHDVRIDREASRDPRLPRRNVYFFNTPDGAFGAQQEDVLHFPGFGFNGCESMSVIQWGARNGIGIAIKGDEFAGKHFANGAQPQFAVNAPGSMTAKMQEEFIAAWVAKYGAGQGPNNKPLILTEGLKIEQLTMTAVDAQLLESRQWQVVDVCRAFGVPPFMVGEMGKATYNNTENLGVDFVKYTLSPHLQRIEQELNIKLWPRSLRLFTEFNTDGLMRGDVTARANYYKAALGGTQNPAWFTPNEVRRLENMPPIEGGDSLSKPDPKAKPEPNQNPDAEPDPNKEAGATAS